MANASDPTDEQFAQLLTRALVGKRAPHELDLFEELYEMPVIQERDRNAADGLAFGIGDLVAIVTPTLAFVASITVKYIIDNAAEFSAEITKGAAKDAIKNVLVRRIESVLDRKPVEQSLPVDRLAVVGLLSVLQKEAMKYGLEPSEAAELADSVRELLGLKRI